MANASRVAEQVWFDGGAGARLTRAALLPLSLAYRGVVALRGSLYDAGALPARALALPAVSIGNLTVGGTGKTPIAAWFANRLHERGARPAIVLRGYGDDEPLVHRVLTTDAVVIADADRVRGVAEAARGGADVAVLDDAFQHRRARRAIDVVLLAAEHADTPVRLLPAGPYREPLEALRRAALVVVTRKSADDATVARVLARASRAAPNVEQASVALALDTLRRWDDVATTLRVSDGMNGDADHATVMSLNALRGERVLAIAAVGAPSAFFAQLTARGASVEGVAFADHHAFAARDVDALTSRAQGVDRVVCTLKDAVKLGPLWPRLARPLWYVSQRVTPERNGDALDHIVARLLSMRTR